MGGVPHAPSPAPPDPGHGMELCDIPVDNQPLTQASQENSSDASQSSSEDSTPETPENEAEATLLVDARNGFNKINRKSMLWTTRHLWANGARFSFNCYRHSAQLILRRRNAPCKQLLSQEGVTQGDPLSMVLYGLALVPLGKILRDEFPTILQPWYADDAAMSGIAHNIAPVMDRLMELGPQCGYYPEPEKSIVVCTEETRDAVEKHLGRFNFRFSMGERYIGGFVGSDEAREKWLREKVVNWVEGVERLARVAKRFPQSAYTGLTRSLQMEWRYLQRVLPEAGKHFRPIEEAIRSTFLPALFGPHVPAPEAKDRDLYGIPVRKAGLGLPNPATSAQECYMTSADTSQYLSDSLRQGGEFSVDTYCEQARHMRKAAKARRDEEYDQIHDQFYDSVRDPDKRCIGRAKETGAWLTAMPSHLHGTELSAEEFRDALLLRYGFEPRGLAWKCDGCSADFSVEHALSCKVGGLVTLRHDTLKQEWHHLCARALKPLAVSDEPLIYACQDPVATGNSEINPELRGDVAVHGFWTKGKTTVFDVRVTDTDAPTYVKRKQSPASILARHEKWKNDKYLKPCQERRRHFTPLVFSVDGMRGNQATAASKRLASLLSEKWNRPYSEVCGFVRSQLSVALVRSLSQCLRGPRDPLSRANHVSWLDGAGLAGYRA